MGNSLMLGIIVTVIFVTILIVRLFILGKELRHKDLKLMQYYLDKKFLYNSITSGTNKLEIRTFQIDLIENIKIYFQLDEIIVIRHEEIASGLQENGSFKKQLYDCILTHYQQQPANAAQSIITSIEHNKNKYTIFMFFRPKEKERKKYEVIVCTKNAKEILSKDEIMTLDMLINLLRIFLIA